MNIKKIQINDKIFLLVFNTQHDITSALLRFQEFYESPKFKGRIFTLDEFKKWYISIKGSFSYYHDWNGFNMPSNTLAPFYKGKFNPLSKSEKIVLSLFKKQKGNFYIIGVHKDMKENKFKELLKHELAHALFYTIKEYKMEIMKVFNSFEINKIKEKLVLLGGTLIKF